MVPPRSCTLQLGDWLLLVQPVVADLTTASDIWWDRMMTEVEKWYQDHQAMAPLDQVKHEPVPPSSLSVPKWAKLERRMATLLLKAIPEVHKNELVATKRLSVFAILAHLHVTYCPGGISEKQMLLRNLEDPTEPGNLHDTVVGLLACKGSGDWRPVHPGQGSESLDEASFGWQ